MKKIRLSAVSYLNTKPFLYGLLNHPIAQQLEIATAIPSECAQRLLAGTTDLALVPVAVLPQLDSYHIVSDYCIGTLGAVKTVAIYGEVPIEEMDTILLDFHSRTSVELSRLLLEEYWQLQPQLVNAQEGYIKKIKGSTGGLVIGDRTIGLEKRFPYHYDLGSIWQAHTGLPFVFAAWVSREPLAADFLQAFNQALAAGLAKLPELQLLLPSPDPDFDLVDYFTNYISYDLDADKRKALDRFLAYLSASVPLSC